MLKNKSGKLDYLGIILVIAAIIVVAKTGVFSDLFSASAGSSGTTDETTTPSNTVTVVGAPCTQATTLTMSTIRQYLETALTAENVTIIQNGVLKGTIAHGSTTTVQSGPNADTLDLYNGLQSATYYTTHTQGKLGTCTGSATSGDPQFKLVTNDENAVGGIPVSMSSSPNHLFQIDTNGNSNWFSIVNDGQANQNTGGQGQGTGANLTIGSGGTGSVTITFRPGFNQAMGAIGGNILACQYPQAVYDSADPILVTFAGKSLVKTSTKPSSQNYPLIAANNSITAFVMPGVDGRATPSIEMKVLLRADSNHNPAGANDRINCTIFDSGYYQRQSDGKYVLDIENRDTNARIPATMAPKPSFEIGVA